MAEQLFLLAFPEARDMDTKVTQNGTHDCLDTALKWTYWEKVADRVPPIIDIIPKNIMMVRFAAFDDRHLWPRREQ